MSHCDTDNKTGLQPISRTVLQIHGLAAAWVPAPYGLGGVKMGYFLTSKLGLAWVGAWVDAGMCSVAMYPIACFGWQTEACLLIN